MRLVSISLLLCAGLGIAATYVRAWSQDLPEIEHLAAQTSARAAKSKPKRVLIGVRSGCMLNAQLCEALDASLRTDLDKLIAGVQFVSNDDVMQALKKQGFLSIDIYEEHLLRTLAHGLDAEVAVIDNLTETSKGYEMTSKIVDVSRDKETGTFNAKIARSSPEIDDKSLVIRDPESGVSLVIPRVDASRIGGSHPLYFPSCSYCPDPKYTEEAKRKGREGTMVFLVTVTAQGVTNQMNLIKTFDMGMVPNAVETINSWRFTPAIGPDGHPFAARVPLEITYRLRH